MTLPSRKVLLATPLLLAGASCVPPPVSVARLAPPAAAAPGEGAMPGFSLVEANPMPVSSLGRLAPADEARWTQAAAMLAPPSTTPAAPFELGGGEADARRALECLTSAVYHEARSEGEDGQRAVAQVVLNRVRHPAFPASVCGVVFEGSGRRTGCQFSFTCDGSLGRRREAYAWDRAREIAGEALNGAVYAAVGNATHYHTRAILPYWAPSLRRAAIVGEHIFYRWQGGAGRARAFTQDHRGEPGANPIRPALARAEAAEVKPVRAARAAAPPAKAVERVEVEGGIVVIRRGGMPPAVRQAEQAGVRIHAGLPDFVQAGL